MRQVSRQQFYLMCLNEWNQLEIVWGRHLHYYFHLGKINYLVIQ